MNFNGLRTERRKQTVFVALPPEAWRPISGGCGCDYCKAHPDKTPMWDTLLVNPTANGTYSDRTSTCHYPAFSQ